AQEVWVDLVFGMPLAGVPLRPDRPQRELAHQPPDAPTADRNPLSQQRHLKPTAAVNGIVGENPVEPLHKLEAPPQIPAADGKSCCARSPARIAGLRTAPLPARSSPASECREQSEWSGYGGH